MKAVLFESNQQLKTKSLFPTSEKVKKFRLDLENSTEDRFKEIDRAKSMSLDESRKKYLD